MRLRELFEAKLDSKIKDAILVMMSRSRTIGEPYELSYDQLARVIDYPGRITKADIDAAVEKDAELSAKITNYDEDFIEIDAQAEPSDLDLDAGADMSGAQDLGMDAAAEPSADAAGAIDLTPPGAELGSEPTAEPPAPEEPVQKIDVVKKMADRAATRRSK
jgi:hypothetical protein